MLGGDERTLVQREGEQHVTLPTRPAVKVAHKLAQRMRPWSVLSGFSNYCSSIVACWHVAQREGGGLV